MNTRPAGSRNKHLTKTAAWLVATAPIAAARALAGSARRQARPTGLEDLSREAV